MTDAKDFDAFITELPDSRLIAIWESAEDHDKPTELEQAVIIEMKRRDLGFGNDRAND